MNLDILEKAAVRYAAHLFPWHVHPAYHCLSLVTDGGATLDIPGQRIQVLPGDLVFIPAGLPHRTLVEHSFSYEIIRFRKKSGVGLLPFRKVRDPEIVEQFHRWHTEGRTYKEDYSFLATFLAWPGDTQELAQDTAIIRCLELMHSHFTEGLSLEDLSRAALRSSSHLLRTFKAQVGISPARYLMGLKIDHSKVLIQEGHSLVDTALRTGFYDHSHFSRHFKQLSGLSPKVYQKLVLQ